MKQKIVLFGVIAALAVFFIAWGTRSNEKKEVPEADLWNENASVERVLPPLDEALVETDEEIEIVMEDSSTQETTLESETIIVVETSEAEFAQTSDVAGQDTRDVLTDSAVGTGTNDMIETASPATYTVRSGDSLSRISMELFGTEAHWQAIYEANKDQLKNPNDLQIGQKLIIPKVD